MGILKMEFNVQNTCLLVCVILQDKNKNVYICFQIHEIEMIYDQYYCIKDSKRSLETL